MFITAICYLQACWSSTTICGLRKKNGQLPMQVVDHITQDRSSAWPSRSSPPYPTESTPLLAGASSNTSLSKAPSTGVFTAWTNATQNLIVPGKPHPIQHLQKAPTIRSLASHEWVMDSQNHRHSNSGQVSPPSRRLPDARPPSPVSIASLDNIPPGPTDRPTETISQSPSSIVARDHLASERTFLAYVRTSLAIVSAGVALVQFVSAAMNRNPEAHWLHAYIRPLGSTTVIIGLTVLLIGAARYFLIQSALTNGYFPVARLAIGFIAIVLSALMTLTFGILLAGKIRGIK
ncbi:hypothetical protein M413DRAFT_13086 [Hebeloma cylindrosporum]|uniref:DUF202 domain-containing protein n=1 Tax=Hebeloma cylindrosporum TaxID=76867 RepID=A0A0C3BMH3_HEBCY|nr:hypothetical protein M413DRAFT_13086 [Hebeloma cylindrosporum h7]